MNDPQAPRPGPVLKSGLYWRQSMWNARKCVPAILSTDGTTLSLSSATGNAFFVPCSQVEAKFSTLQTMMLFVEGNRYDIVGKPANLSPDFTDAQRAELAQADHEISEAGGMAGTALAGLVGLEMLATIAGVDGLVFDAHAMWKNIKPWKKILPAIGVRMR